MPLPSQIVDHIRVDLDIEIALIWQAHEYHAADQGRGRSYDEKPLWLTKAIIEVHRCVRHHILVGHKAGHQWSVAAESVARYAHDCMMGNIFGSCLPWLWAK